MKKFTYSFLLFGALCLIGTTYSTPSLAQHNHDGHDHESDDVDMDGKTVDDGHYGGDDGLVGVPHGETNRSSREAYRPPSRDESASDRRARQREEVKSFRERRRERSDSRGVYTRY